MKYALIIGINYTGTTNALKGPVQDMYRIRNSLVGYEITLMPDRIATKENILQTFALFIQKKGTLFFYFSGHGRKEPESILTSDDDFITHTDFRTMIDTMDPESTLVSVIDTCFSGNLFDLSYRWTGEWTDVEPVDTPGHVFLLSSSLETETSLEYTIKTLSFGAFTHSYLHAIRAGPTWRQLIEHVTSHTHLQTPVLTTGQSENIDSLVLI